MSWFLTLAVKLVRSEDAASMVEYGLLVGLIAIVVAAGASLFGASVSTLFTNASNSL